MRFFLMALLVASAVSIKAQAAEPSPAGSYFCFYIDLITLKVTYPDGLQIVVISEDGTAGIYSRSHSEAGVRRQDLVHPMSLISGGFMMKTYSTDGTLPYGPTTFTLTLNRYDAGVLKEMKKNDLTGKFEPMIFLCERE